MLFVVLLDRLLLVVLQLPYNSGGYETTGAAPGTISTYASPPATGADNGATGAGSRGLSNNGLNSHKILGGTP